MTTKLARRIGQRVTQVRRERGLTSEQLAYQFGISKGYLSDIENGKKLPSLTMLARLAAALKIDIKDLF